jgi:hypothetical protein
VTLAALAEWIAASGVVRGAALAEDDVRQAVDSLVFEGLVEDVRLFICLRCDVFVVWVEGV